MAHFIVKARIAEILGLSYRSTEKALKELVDNAWDADARTVRISLPGPVDLNQQVVVEDDGCGMSPDQFRAQYLEVGRDRRASGGRKTRVFHRLVKGRKGVGKFAGLAVASRMEITTVAGGQCLSAEIDKAILATDGAALDDIEVPTEVHSNPEVADGTRIVLTGVSRSLRLPSPDALRRLLSREYGRANDFAIYVDGVRLTAADVGGGAEAITIDFGDGTVAGSFSYAERPLPAGQSGVVFRVDGKIVGDPTFLGLDADEGIPRGVLERVSVDIELGEIVSDEDVLNDWGALNESSVRVQAVKDATRERLREFAADHGRNEIEFARRAIEAESAQRIEKMPAERRPLAKKALERVLRKFYDQPRDRLRDIVDVALDAVEQDEYYAVLAQLNATERADVLAISRALETFGFIDLAVIARQTDRRLQALQRFRDLIDNDATLEQTIHKAIEDNLWILGEERDVLVSNKTLKQTLEKVFGATLVNERGDKRRPDLLLSSRTGTGLLLVELKRPSIAFGRDHEAQAKKYRDRLKPVVGDREIEILVIVGRVAKEVDPGRRVVDRLDVITYTQMVADAENRLRWLLDELADPRSGA